MSTDLITRVEHGRLWFLGRLLVPKSRRRASCERRGEHKPGLIDGGRSKICRGCGTW